MLYSEKNSKPFWIAAITLVIIFASCVVISPKIYAASTGQSREQTLTPAEKAAKSQQYIDLLSNIFSFVEQNYVDEIDSRILYEGALTGLMNSLQDPYTAYLDTSNMRSLNDTTVGNFGGVGLSITKQNSSTADIPAYVEVASPIEEGPGWKAGIQSGDLIISIEGVSTADITMEQVLSMLRGKVGESVQVVIRRGKKMEFPVTLVREIIEVPAVKFSMINDTIGYVRIIEFTPQTPARVQAALDAFAAAKYTGLIIDLRNNPGGLITSVAAVADKFIDEGVIVSTRSRRTKDESQFMASPAKTTVPKGLPIVVLINRGSASASEILAGALKDDHLAYLVGENTFGKGSVQQVLPLSNSDGIKFTMARYYTPSNSNIDKVGIPPDREVLFPKLTVEEEKTYEDLYTSTVIADYVGDHPDMGTKEIAAYAEELKKTYDLDLRLLRRMISLQVYRTKIQPLYDLDYDVQLQEAVSILTDESVSVLLSQTKTISELQAEAAKKVAAEAEKSVAGNK